MTAQFTVRADPTRDLIRIVLAGFFTTADLAAFRAALAAEHSRLTCGANRHITLIEVSAMKVQSQEMVAAFQALLADPQFHSRRLAFVVDPTLIRSQLKRALGGRDARCFDSVVAARTWLLADSARAAAA